MFTKYFNTHNKNKKEVFKITHKYLSYIDDDALLSAIDIMYNKYSEVYSGFDYSHFTKNVIDPFQMLFDMHFTGINVNEWISNEVARQVGKSLSNAFGSFQESIIGLSSNYTQYPVGDPNAHGVDCISNDQTVFADIKNKYNTLNSNAQSALWDKLNKITEDFPDATTYHVQIITNVNNKNNDSVSFNKTWKVSKKTDNKRIRLISGDHFYNLVFNSPNAFKELVDILPTVLDDYMTINKKERILDAGNMSLFMELGNMTDNAGLGTDHWQFIKNDMFKKYLGFQNK